MKNLISVLILVASSMVAGQRPPYAGLSPIGYPIPENRTTTTPDPLGNRFGEGNTLPIEANGDWDLIDRLSKMPLDKQPFWFINWQALDKNRKDPQTYPQRPSVFVDPVPHNSNTGQGNTQFSAPNPGLPQNAIYDRFGHNTSQPSGNFNSNSNTNQTVDRFATINSTSNVYTNSNNNSNTYPGSNPNRNVQVPVNGNPNPYPNVNTNPNPYPNVNANPNPYPNVNANPNPYPNVNANPNPYPNVNVNPNYYPGVNPNSNPVVGNRNTDNWPHRSGNNFQY